MMASRFAARVDAAPADGLARAIERSLLSGEPGLDPQRLATAARFVLAAARTRQPGAPVVVVESVSATRTTRIVAINPDMPYLVDSIAATIASFGLAIDRLVHPVVSVRRDGTGTLVALPDDIGAGLPQESMVYIEADRADARTRVALRAALIETLGDVHAAVTDWPWMRAALASDADAVARGGPECTEAAALLRWLGDGRLTQLGHVVRRRDGDETGALGICRGGNRPLLAARSYERAFAWFDSGSDRPLLAIKANLTSRVHRRVPLDLFIVPRVEAGRTVALSVHAGIWTSVALAARPSEVPVLRRRLADIMRQRDYDPAGHAGKALVHALTALPHDVLIGIEAPEIERIATTTISLIDRPRPHLLLLRAPLDRHLHAFVWLPRDALSSDLRFQVQAMVAQAAHGEVIDWTLAVDDTLATIRLLLDVREGDAGVDEASLGVRLRALVRGWPEAVEAALASDEALGRAAAIASRYADAFPLAYRTTYGAIEAATDIRRLRALGGDEVGGDARLYCLGGCTPGQLRLKLYRHAGALALSDAVPMIENFGFRVIAQDETQLDGGALGSIHDFTLELPAGLDGEALLARGPEIDRAVAAVLNGGDEDDGFNRLIAGAGLTARETGWLRAIYRYLRQTGMRYELATVVDALRAAPQVTRGLIELFVARHDPEFRAEREAGAASAAAAIREGLAQVGAINDDRLLRRYLAVIEAIVRTNAFVPQALFTGETALAFKLDSALVPALPRPVPWREIFVYSRRVEGIHLRAGPIARGGLRWSDRRDDFRTEVLGLMKAQRVKNAVIVPTGAKGGFYPKQLPDPSRDREGWLAEGTTSYKVFVRSLLSLTDNLVEGRVVHPAGMVIADGDDPYFVVAADKGTATFSDIANALAAERDFWLDDAFASGGSKGYDHKAMGITARGAWFSVERHFGELGIDVARDSVRVVGCGDMSGDVFGNGMLLSKALRLVAAFDHRHIFIDPAPDAAAGWAERARLFALPRSSWDDYDKALLSPGGGVFPRGAKQIALSPQAQAALGIADDATEPALIEPALIEPEALIRAILAAPVDLLWFGGIGTYVKASAEADSAVGDPNNEALRIDARTVRARVIGEGANLGCTQAGRIEFALVGAGGTVNAAGARSAGGRINTDFIDNSAGVDCSDHEVNIKIALASARRAGRLTEEQRVALLVSMTDEVAAQVLEDNRLQALALSIAEAGGAAATPAYLALIEALEERGWIDRRTDGLADADTLSRRAAEGRGLTRPELAVIVSSAKLALQAALEQSDLPDDPALEDELFAAFPSAMRVDFAADIAGHRLRREIIATRIANRMINRIGLLDPFELIEEEGADSAQVTAAFVAAERLFGMDALWTGLESAAMPETARIALFDRAAAGLRPHIADLLRGGIGHATIGVLIADLADPVRAVSGAAACVLGREARAASDESRAQLAAIGAPPAQAAQVAGLFELDGAIGLAKLARQTGIAAQNLAAAFVDIGARLGLDWAQGKAALMAPVDPWERLLVGGLARDFQQMRLDFLARIAGDDHDPLAAVARWATTHGAAIAQFVAVIARARAAAGASPAMLAQIAGQARGLLGR